MFVDFKAGEFGRHRHLTLASNASEMFSPTHFTNIISNYTEYEHCLGPLNSMMGSRVVKYCITSITDAIRTLNNYKYAGIVVNYITFILYNHIRIGSLLHLSVKTITPSTA